MEVATAFINKASNNTNSSSSAVPAPAPSSCESIINNSSNSKRVVWEPESGSILDPFHIEDLLDFSNEDIAGPIGEEVNNNNNNSSSSSAAASSELKNSTTTTNNSSALSGVDHPTPNEFSIDCDAMPELEWLSSLVEDDTTFSMGELPKNMFIGSKGGAGAGAPCYSTPLTASAIVQNKRSYNLLIEESSNNNKDRFQVGSPISVLESSSATSGRLLNVGKDGRDLPVPGRPRSKRSRTSSPKRSPWNNNTSSCSVMITTPGAPISSAINNNINVVVSSSSPATSSISDKDFVSSEDTSVDSLLLGDDHPLLISNSSPLKPPPKPPLKASPSSATAATSNNNIINTGSVAGGGPLGLGAQPPEPRRCTHCLSQKTPQWRAGPEGPKTLCNACGVRFKSGRLFPEYRPALSPTFLSEVHSNSHRKVLEMRRHKETPVRPSSLSSMNSNSQQQHHHHPQQQHQLQVQGEVVDGGLIYK